MKKNRKIVLVILIVFILIALYLLFRNNFKKYIIMESSKYTIEQKEKPNGQKYILFTISGLYGCSDDVELSKKEIDNNNNLNLYFDYIEDCGDWAESTKEFEIPLNENINEIKPFYRVKKTLRCNDVTIDKPIIYIYPNKEIDLTIKLKNNDLLTYTYPKYNNEWNVHVDTKGNIYDYKSKRNYYALYWEALDNTKVDMNEGFVVEGTEIVEFLEEKLKYLGLNEKEINEFIIYWIDKLEGNKYNYIRFRSIEEINKYMPLEFSINPDALIRVVMDYKPLDKKITVKEQVLEKKERHGFTVVEWGGHKITNS